MKTRLFLNYYKDSNPERQKELDYCLNMNLNNPLIDKIYALSEFEVPGAEVIPFEGRPTFSDFFSLANERADPDDVVIIANTDIYFDATLQYAFTMDPVQAFALSRTDNLSWDSQDGWIFKGPVKRMDANFCLGVPGTDNRIAWEMRNAGYQVSNPALTIKATHLHASQIRHYDENTEKVRRPYLLVTPVRLGQVSPQHIVQ
jgi:hypothetical protein